MKMMPKSTIMQTCKRIAKRKSIPASKDNGLGVDNPPTIYITSEVACASRRTCGFVKINGKV